MTLRDQVEVAYAAFTERTAGAVGDDAATRRVADAYARLGEVAQQDPARLPAAFDEYRDLLARTVGADSARAGVQDAFSRFLRAVGDAWPRDGASPEEVAALADALHAAAWVAWVSTDGHAPGQPGGAPDGHAAGRGATGWPATPVTAINGSAVGGTVEAADTNDETPPGEVAGWGPTSVLE
ncbi:hypothetical protein Cch01nite_39250 [Cellulomonas chitinilytica]|uniref:Uncharacterized protein n=1 Tax=Cellulomonas chitinilytica TaxID=398759 RepID=A0A919P4A4_9CELL|nr:hypothetical protein [Cellulomonas chitinilytica]GIG23201.1 hypothetical protein Cch01nite_39250 [Cellulomonas chitinilytica]